MDDEEKIMEICDHLKYCDSNVTIEYATYVYNNIYQNPLIIEASEEIKPMMEFINLRPDLQWFIDDKRIAIEGRKEGKILKQKHPNITKDEFLSMIICIWKDILHDFVTLNGYSTI